MDIKKLIKKGQFKFEQNKGLIFTILAGTFEIAAIIAMAKQAPKAEKILIPVNKKIEELKNDINDTEKIANNLVNVEDTKKEIRKTQAQTFVKLAKTYALPVIFTGISLAFMGGSYKVMRDKEIALGAAYVALDNAYKAYRNRVKEEVGEETENKLFRDIRDKKVTRQVEDPVTGEIKEVEDTVKASGGTGAYDFIFDAAAHLFSRNGRVNYETLSNKERELTQILRSQGYIYGDTIIEILGIPKFTLSKDLLKALRVIGIIDGVDEYGRPKKVLLGINDYDGHPNEIGQELFEGAENTVWLSPNFDGVIVNDYVNHIRD